MAMSRSSVKIIGPYEHCENKSNNLDFLQVGTVILCPAVEELSEIKIIMDYSTRDCSGEGNANTCATLSGQHVNL